MNKLFLREVKALQNPALGAVAIRQFTQGYYSTGNKISLPLPLIFIVIPILFSDDFSQILKSTKAGLYKYASKLESEKALIAELQKRIINFKYLSAESLIMAINTNLISSDFGALNIKLTDYQIKKLPSGCKDFYNNATKLGEWFSDFNLDGILGILMVRL